MKLTILIAAEIIEEHIETEYPGTTIHDVIMLQGDDGRRFIAASVECSETVGQQLSLMSGMDGEPN